MQTSQRYLLTYALLAFIMLIIEYANYSTGRYIIKPLLMIVLILYIAMVKPSTERNFIILALLFSLVGDIFLLFPAYKLAFIGGLLSFLVAHINYACAFKINAKNVKHSLTRLSIIIPIFLILIFATVFYIVLKPSLGTMLLPVSVYMIIILIMVIMAILRKNSVNNSSYYKVMAGSLLFLISDSMLAVDKFAVHIKYAGLWVMLSYILAQVLIANGIKTGLILSSSPNYKQDLKNES